MNISAQTIKASILGNIELLKSDIKNCPDDLWESRIGGDYYWEQIYHALISIYGLLPVERAVLELKIENAGKLDGKSNPEEHHDKNLMLSIAERTIEHVDEYFSKITDENLHGEATFMGQKTTVMANLLIATGHLMYHLGVCDTALRNNGNKGAI